MQKGTDLRASVLLSLAAKTSLLSGTSRVVFLLRSLELPATRPLLAPHASPASFSLMCYGLIPTCSGKMRSSSVSSRSFVSFTTTVWVPGISCPLGVSVRRCSCAKFALHSASKVIGLLMKSVWSYGDFEAVTDVPLEGHWLVSLPSASTSGSSPWFRKEACNMPSQRY